MRRTSSKKQRSIIPKLPLNHKQMKCSRNKKQKAVSQQQFTDLLEEIRKFQDKVINLQQSRKFTSNQKNNFQDIYYDPQANTQRYTKNNSSIIKSNYKTEKLTNSCYPIKNIINSDNGVHEIKFVIDTTNNLNKDLNIKELTKKVKQLQQKNCYLSQQKILLQQKLLFQEMQKKRLQQKLLQDSKTPHKNQCIQQYLNDVYIKQKKTKGNFSPVNKQQRLADSVNILKSPYKAYLQDSRNSQFANSHYTKGFSRKAPIISEISEDQKQKRKYIDKKTTLFRFQDDEPTIYLNQISTIKDKEFKNCLKSNVSYFGESNISDFVQTHKNKLKVHSCEKKNPRDKQQRHKLKKDKNQEDQPLLFNHINDQPRITFSKQLTVPKNKQPDQQLLKMLEQYFERLLGLSRIQKNKEKKDKIRKQMSQIAQDIHKLRKTLKIQ